MKDAEHRCKALPGNGLGVYRAEHFLNGENWVWCLVAQRRATESDLEANHYLENIGDTIWSTAIGISYCPFRGDLLSDAKRSKSSPDAEYQHVDYSGWIAKVQ